MLFSLLLSFAHASIMQDLDGCATQATLRPQLETVALATLAGHESSRKRAMLALETARWNKARCVGEVMTNYLGPLYPALARFNPYARAALVNAQLYLGVKRAEYEKQRCGSHPQRVCGTPEIMLDIERRLMNTTLTSFFDDFEREYPKKTVTDVNQERLSAIDRQIHELERSSADSL